MLKKLGFISYVYMAFTNLWHSDWDFLVEYVWVFLVF